MDLLTAAGDVEHAPRPALRKNACKGSAGICSMEHDGGDRDGGEHVMGDGLADRCLLYIHMPGISAAAWEACRGVRRRRQFCGKLALDRASGALFLSRPAWSLMASTRLTFKT